MKDGMEVLSIRQAYPPQLPASINDNKRHPAILLIRQSLSIQTADINIRKGRAMTIYRMSENLVL